MSNGFMVVQLVYIGELGYLAIKGIKLNSEDPMVGEMHITCPDNVDRVVPYTIKGSVAFLGQVPIPSIFVSHFLLVNDCVETREDGSEHVLFKEVEFKTEQ